MIAKWKEFLQIPYGQTCVPEWFNKLQSVIQSQQEPDVQTCEVQDNTLEEWMILSDLNIPFHTTGNRTGPSILTNKLVKCPCG